MSRLTRYNFGFKFFGPLEKCADGKYVKAEDALKLENDRDWYEANYHRLVGTVKVHEENIKKLELETQRLEKKLRNANFSMGVVMVLTIVVIVLNRTIFMIH